MSKMILIVDDEEDILFILKSVLSRKGYRVKEAYSGEEAIETLKKEKPDLIFMDIMMPGIDGWDAARHIKTDPTTKGIPLSMLSVKSDPEDRKRSRDYAMADDHLSKPIDFNALISTVDSLIEKNT